MRTNTFWESFKAEGENVAEKVKQIVHEGNVRRVLVKQNGITVAEFPLTAGVVGAVIAPVLAAIGALVALMKDCTIEIERTSESAPKSEAAAVSTEPVAKGA
jgi:D-aminopeptidase